MKNPLKDIFNADKPKYGLTIQFNNSESKSKFIETINQAVESGEYKEIKGILKVDSYIKNNEYLHKLDSYDNKSKKFVGPVKKKLPFTIDTDYGNYTFDFESYKSFDYNVIKTNENTSALYVKIIIRSNKKDNLSFKLNLNIAENVQDIIQTLNAIQHLLKLFFNNDADKVNEQVRILKDWEDYWKMVRKIELIFNVTFNPKKISEDLEQVYKDEKNVLEFYFLFVKKCFIKQNSINSLTINLSKNLYNKIPQIGEKIGLSYVDTVKREIYGEPFEFFTQNFIFKATISKIEELDDDMLRIHITGTDTEPLTLIYRAYKTEEDIDIINDFNKVDFKAAKTLSELKKELNDTK